MEWEKLDEEGVRYLLGRTQYKLKWIGEGGFAISGSERIFVCTRTELTVIDRVAMVDLVLGRLFSKGGLGDGSSVR